MGRWPILLRSIVPYVVALHVAAQKEYITRCAVDKPDLSGLRNRHSRFRLGPVTIGEKGRYGGLPSYRWFPYNRCVLNVLGG